MLLGLIFWFVFSSICFVEYFHIIKELDDGEKVLVIVLLLIFGPAIVMSNLAEEMLDLILPEGWDDNDNHISRY